MKKYLLIAGIVLLASGLFAQKGPNILWITIEDTSPQFIGCYGNKDARTPVIDKLAREGVRFTNAFSTGTVCSPSRSTIITGLRTFEAGTGNHRSSYPIPKSIHGFPYYMQQRGYYTTNNSKTDYNVAKPGEFTKDAWNESSGKAGWWNRQPGQPFFAVFNFNDSHQSRTMTDTYPMYVKEVLEELPAADRIAENEFDMPPFYRDSPEMRKQFARVYNAIKLTDNKIGELLKRLEKDKLRDSTIIFFYADHGEGIPRGKTNGINLGYRVPFVVWFPPLYRHLSPWGTSGIVTDELIDFEDLAPTLISLAGSTLPTHLKGRILMGEHRTAPTDHLILSSDRSDNGIDMSRGVTDGRYLYARNYLPYMPQARYIRYMEIGDIKQQMRQDLADNKLNALQKSLFEPRPAEYLYDTKEDSWEMKNLANDPAYVKKIAQMRKQLEETVLKSRDVLFLPEYEIAKLSEHTTPYEFRLDDQKYPVKHIFAAASLSGFRSKESARKQVALLADKNKIVRYWAILGLRAQEKTTLLPIKMAVMAAQKDPYEPTALMASVIAYETFQDKEAEQSLRQFCLSENTELSLMAINEVLYFTNKKPFIETIQNLHKSLADSPKGGDFYKVKAACMDVLGSVGLVPNNPSYSE